jgi:hypothetical protein
MQQQWAVFALAVHQNPFSEKTPEQSSKSAD